MENSPKQQEDGKQIVRVLACVLNKLIEANHGMPNVGSRDVTKFHALEPPSISVLDYLERINKYSCCSNECFILSLIYIDRLIQMNNFALTSLNVHRVIITSVMLAAKFFDDQYFNNAYYAKVGGVPVGEMNILEVELLFRLNFSLHVTTDVFKKYKSELSHHASINMCKCVSGAAPPAEQHQGNQRANSTSNSAVPNKRANVQNSKQGKCEPPETVSRKTEPQSSVYSSQYVVDSHYPVYPSCHEDTLLAVPISYFSSYAPNHFGYPQLVVNSQVDPHLNLSHCSSVKSYHNSGWVKAQTQISYFPEGNSYAVLNGI